MRILSRTCITMIALLCASVALATPPAYVTGLRAELQEDGSVKVEWNAQPGEDVAYYRVYYSFESILENGGLYDDFEQTDGVQTEFVFADPPDVGTLFIAVIGVSPAGEDINLFVEEVAVNLTETVSPPMEEEEEQPQSEEEEPQTMEIREETVTLPIEEQEQPTIPTEAGVDFPSEPTSVQLTSAVALSPTEVEITLNTPVTVEPEQAPLAFRIVDAVGTSLRIARMIIQGTTMRVTTAQQEQGRIYEFSMRSPVRSPQGLPLDVVQNRVYFEGHPQGSAPTGPQPQPADWEQARAQGGVPTETTPTEVQQNSTAQLTNFRLAALAQGNGLYTVTAVWDVIGNIDSLAYLLTNQSRDGGKTFGASQMVNPGVGGAQIPDVSPGMFGLSVALVQRDGGILPGGFQNIVLGTSAVAGTPTAQITSSHGGLSSSGAPAALLAFAVAGGVAGWRKMRKRVQA
ncbi:hypothetical protein COU80_01110 [Candidatus Peregrinibacteria bacterium CG10_big_fil_rev_8_21_14_0_10_55_24]|nr:MAG: hypothetical protein COU80_01110 [Candidatus Peregrinibacteria bacterium CG10_big_fil_rev_8_21_14_0_10_55_24]